MAGVRMLSSTPGAKVDNNTLTPSDKTQEISNETVSGAPKSLSRDRIVRIYKQAKAATQSGNWGMCIDSFVFVV